MFHIFSQELEIDIQKREWNYLNRKWNYLSHFQADDQKTTFTKCFSFTPRSLIFETGNRIIQTGNGIIYPISRPLIKKLLLQSVSNLFQGVQTFECKIRQFLDLFCPKRPNFGPNSEKNRPFGNTATARHGNSGRLASYYIATQLVRLY